MKNLLAIGVLCVAALASASQAQFSITGRSSVVNYDYLYGFAADTRTGNDMQSSSALLLNGGAGLADSSSGNGVYIPSGHVWSAAVTWNVSHTYAVTGALGSATRVSSSGLSTLTSTQVGATSGVGSNNPGNQLSLEFSVGVGQDLRLFGSVEQSGPFNRNGSIVYLYRSDGAGGWTLLYLTAIPNAGFDTTRFFDAGVYRIDAFASANAGQDEATHAGWNYTLEVVPSPSAAALLGLGGLLASSRRRRPHAPHA